MNNIRRNLLATAGIALGLFTALPATAAFAECDASLGSTLCPQSSEPAPAESQPAPEPKPAPASKPAAQPAPAQQSPAEAKARLFELVNRDRTAAGLGALSLRGDLNDLAAGHSKRMADAGEIFHNDDLFTPATKARIGAKAVGENVASNMSIDDAHRRLMASPGHRANLMSNTFSVLGIGLANVNGTWYVTEVFITPVAGAAAKPAVAAAAAKPVSAARPTPAPRAARTAAPAAAASAVEVAPEAPVTTEAPVELTTVAPSTGTVMATDSSAAVGTAGKFAATLSLLVALGLAATKVRFRLATVRTAASI